MNRGYYKVLMLLGCAVLAACTSSAERQVDLEKKEKLIDTHIQLGAVYLQRNQLDIAKENIDKALKIDPDNSQANNMMALLQLRIKKYDEAERYLRRAVESTPENPEAQNNYGVFLCDRERLSEAEIWFKKAIANPYYKTPAEANLNAGLCLMKKPAPASAEKYFREALTINPKLPGALYQMAKISFDAGRTLAARGFMERYFQAATDTPESLLLAVKTERALGNKNAEASYALRLKSRFPDSAEVGQLPKAVVSKKKK